MFSKLQIFIFKGTVANQALLTLHRGSLEITRTFPYTTVQYVQQKYVNYILGLPVM